MQEQRWELIEGLLADARGGGDGATDLLMKAVYEELRYMARGHMRAERSDHTLAATELVHLVFLKLFTHKPLARCDRPYFFAAAGRAMRQLLVEHARRRNAQKRPEGRDRVPLDDLLEGMRTTMRFDLLALEEALQDLESTSAQDHQIVMLRFYGGLKWSEIAEHLDVSLSTVEKSWKFLRAWLYARLQEDQT